MAKERSLHGVNEHFKPLWGIQLMELQRNTHHVFRLTYHFVWISKYVIKYLVSHTAVNLKQSFTKLGTTMILK